MSGTVIDADGTVCTYNGIEIGGITAYEFFDGATPQVEHYSVSAGRRYLPGEPEYGRVRLTLYRNPNDPGQAEMETARATRKTRTLQITLSNLEVRTFPANVEVLPIVGDDIKGVGTARAVLKIAGPTV